MAGIFLPWLAAMVLLIGLPSAFAQPPLTMEQGTNRKGSDYSNFDLPRPDPELCRERCAHDPNCRAYTYVRPGHQGPHARCWLKNAVPPPNPENCCVSGAREGHHGGPYGGAHGFRRLTMEHETNRKGSDYSNFDLPGPDPELCRERCAQDPQCRAYTYVKPGHQGSHARCWLKNAVPAPNREHCCISGTRE